MAECRCSEASRSTITSSIPFRQGEGSRGMGNTRQRCLKIKERAGLASEVCVVVRNVSFTKCPCSPAVPLRQEIDFT